ncbi:Uncharacterised protein [Mycobacteroides abscessus subsp. abscessus]|nr:Uncharacterised protein [Mycobacteroides abscessus subsp. abscessus]
MMMPMMIAANLSGVGELTYLVSIVACIDRPSREADSGRSV